MKKYRNINSLYKDIIKHPENILVTGFEIDDIVDLIIGDIKSKPFYKKIRERVILNKSEIYNILNNTYFRWGWENGTEERDEMLEELCEDIIQKFYPERDIFFDKKYSIN